MATSIIPALIDALVSQSTTNVPTGVQVSDGYQTTDDPGDFLLIGVEDPDSVNPALAADSVQDFATMRVSPGTRNETGEIACVALSWNGDSDQKEARDKVFAITASVENFLRNNPSLGLSPQLLWARFGSTHQLTQDKNDSGAVAMVAFKVAFQARI